MPITMFLCYLPYNSIMKLLPNSGGEKSNKPKIDEKDYSKPLMDKYSKTRFDQLIGELKSGNTNKMRNAADLINKTYAPMLGSQKMSAEQTREFLEAAEKIILNPKFAPHDFESELFIKDLLGSISEDNKKASNALSEWLGKSIRARKQMGKSNQVVKLISERIAEIGSPEACRELISHFQKGDLGFDDLKEAVYGAIFTGSYDENLDVFIDFELSSIGDDFTLLGFTDSKGGHHESIFEDVYEGLNPLAIDRVCKRLEAKLESAKNDGNAVLAEKIKGVLDFAKGVLKEADGKAEDEDNVPGSKSGIAGGFILFIERFNDRVPEKNKYATFLFEIAEKDIASFYRNKDKLENALNAEERRCDAYYNNEEDVKMSEEIQVKLESILGRL